jgi:hypothetical protein
VVSLLVRGKRRKGRVRSSQEEEKGGRKKRGRGKGKGGSTFWLLFVWDRKVTTRSDLEEFVISKKERTKKKKKGNSRL